MEHLLAMEHLGGDGTYSNRQANMCDETAVPWKFTSARQPSAACSLPLYGRRLKDAERNYTITEIELLAKTRRAEAHHL